MSHHHTHDDNPHHGHHHGHDPHHDPGEAPGHGMTFEQKLAKLLDHWIRHNDDHAATYGQWATQARAHGLTETADLIDAAAQATRALNAKFETAAKQVRASS